MSLDTSRNTSISERQISEAKDKVDSIILSALELDSIRHDSDLDFDLAMGMNECKAQSTNHRLQFRLDAAHMHTCTQMYIYKECTEPRVREGGEREREMGVTKGKREARH